ncbi:Formyl-CoA transferase [Mycolicibacterium rhodesiae JS60]|nr:Formyl-CoA transferase [Mycolicibacterium rhodesiae JS60]
MDAMQSLLEGVHVVEFAQLMAGPLCAVTLADLGATVTKVESPHGDYTRTWARPGEESGIFHMLNRGKRGVVLDPRSAADKLAARDLALSADVIVESHGDSMAQVYGFGYDDIAAERPNVVWCSISGLGQGAGGRAIDMTLQAIMGMTALTGTADGPPLRGAMPFVDITTALYGAQAVTAALMQVQRGRGGRFLDCAMLDAAAALTAAPAALALSGFSQPRRMGSESDLFVPSKVFDTADGQYIHVVALSAAHWRAICTTIAREDLLGDQRFASNSDRLGHREFLHGELAREFRRESAQFWCDRITEAGGFCARVREIDEAWTDPALLSRGRLMHIDGLDFAIPLATLVPGEPRAVRGPRLGEHNAELAENARRI